MYGLVAINGIVFGVQGNVQRRLNNPDSITSHMIAGSSAGFVQSFICSPMELAKTRMQVQGQGVKKSKQAIYKGPVDCIVKIYRAEGVRGTFKGLGLTFLRETPSFAVYFSSYEIMARKFQGDLEECPTWAMLLSGGFAGMFCWLSTYPIDVIKSRIQADMKGKYNGFWDCFRQSYKQEGKMVFCRGLT